MAFDIKAQTDRSTAITPDSVDLAAFADRLLSPHTVRVLQYLRQVEQHTIRHLRDVLVTPSHTDPVVTEFLTGWAFQEFWLGETLDAVLELHPAPGAHPPPDRLKLVQGLRDRFAPVRQALLANTIGEDFVAIHMTWAYLDTQVTDRIYRRVADVDEHPTLIEIARRTHELKRIHRDFYAEQALTRLTESRRARTLTRLALTRLWQPPGAAIHAKTETRFVLHYLFDGATARAIDRTVDTLPGLDGLRIVSSAMAKFGVIQS